MEPGRISAAERQWDEQETEPAGKERKAGHREHEIVSVEGGDGDSQAGHEQGQRDLAPDRDQARQQRGQTIDEHRREANAGRGGWQDRRVPGIVAP